MPACITQCLHILTASFARANRYSSALGGPVSLTQFATHAEAVREAAGNGDAARTAIAAARKAAEKERKSRKDAARRKRKRKQEQQQPPQQAQPVTKRACPEKPAALGVGSLVFVDHAGWGPGFTYTITRVAGKNCDLCRTDDGSGDGASSFMGSLRPVSSVH